MAEWHWATDSRSTSCKALRNPIKIVRTDGGQYAGSFYRVIQGVTEEHNAVAY